ncbi:MAG: hypothetical protein AB1918_19490 [Pseudomonadota bacterium]
MGVMPFFSADKAWLWAMANHEFRTNGTALKRGLTRIERDCDYKDILTAATRLGLPQLEMKVIVKYGRLGRAPGKKDPEAERAIWQRAMDRLHTRLSEKGIVQSGTDWAGQSE